MRSAFLSIPCKWKTLLFELNRFLFSFVASDILELTFDLIFLEILPQQSGRFLSFLEIGRLKCQHGFRQAIRAEQ